MVVEDQQQTYFSNGGLAPNQVYENGGIGGEVEITDNLQHNNLTDLKNPPGLKMSGGGTTGPGKTHQSSDPFIMTTEQTQRLIPSLNFNKDGHSSVFVNTNLCTDEI